MHQLYILANWERMITLEDIETILDCLVGVETDVVFVEEDEDGKLEEVVVVVVVVFGLVVV